MANFSLSVFNSIRNDPATGLSNLPEATLSNINTIKTIIDRDPAVYNKYVEAMLVRIGRVYINSPKFADPFDRFDKGENPMGHLVQNIHIDPIHAEGNFDGLGTNPLGRRTLNKPHVAYHRLNYQPKYAISVDRVGMMDAFASWDQLDRYWGEQMRSMYTGAAIDSYTAKRQVLNNAIAATNQGEVLPSAYIGEFKAKDTASGQALMQAIDIILEDMSFPHTYSQAGVVNVTRREDAVILLNKAVRPNINLYTLATLFNDEYATFKNRVMTIDTFNNAATGTANANVLGVITTPDFFQFYTTMNTVRSIENPEGLFNNFFFHPWKTIELNPFAPVVVLRSGDGSIG